MLVLRGTSPDTGTASSLQVEGSSYGQMAGQRRKVQIMKAYRFVLGAENTVQVDYITEKFWQLFSSGWGRPATSPACMRRCKDILLRLTTSCSTEVTLKSQCDTCMPLAFAHHPP